MSRTPAGSVRGILLGAAAGAAGTTALNAVTYVDMAIRGRGSSSTPEDTVESIADATEVEIPGDPETRENRKAGLGPLMGIAAGVGVGAALGALRGRGWNPAPYAMVAVSMAAAMVVGNGPMVALGVTRPTDWSLTDWLSDLAPHAAYGVVTTFALDNLV